MANSYAVEIEDPARFEGVERIIVHSASAANAIAAEKVKALLHAIGYRGDHPTPEYWPQYRNMLRAMIAGDGVPLPDVRIRRLPDLVVLLRTDKRGEGTVALSSTRTGI